MNRFVALISCALLACSLDVSGTGTPETNDDTDLEHARDPSEVAPGAAPASSEPSAISVNAAPPAVSMAAPVNTAAPVDDAGITLTTPPVSTPVQAPDAGSASAPPTKSADPPKSTAFTLASSAFDDGARLPSTFTCKGTDISPPLTWINPPAGTHSFALVLTSKSAAKPDASASVEWVIWQIPATRGALPQAVARGSEPANVPGARQDAGHDGDLTSGFGGGVAGGIAAGGVVAGTGFGTAAGVGAVGGIGGSFAGFGGVAGVSPSIPVGGVSAGVSFYPTDSSGTAPRYHGPCGASAKTYEFTLFALDANATSSWGSFVSVETVTQWIKTRSNVLAQASLSATYP